MADVSAERSAFRERGQMILVAAFGIAVMLVVLALILNTSIYTENIATRGSDISGGKEAIQYRAATEETFVQTIRYVNVHNNTSTTSYTELEEPVRNAVWDHDNMTGRHRAEDSIIVNLQLKRQSKGTHVYQRNDWNFSNENDVGNWTVATTTNGVRDFSVNVTRSDLSAKSPGSATSDDPIFYVEFISGSGSEWYRLFVYDDSSAAAGNEQVVVQSTDDAGNTDRCKQSYDDGRAKIDFTNQSIEGVDCTALEPWTALVGAPFDMEFHNTCVTDGTDACNDSASDTYNVKGKFSFVVNSSISSTNVEPGTPAQDPDARTAIYSTTVHTVYESTRLYYETDIRAAPGEPSD